MIQDILQKLQQIKLGANTAHDYVFAVLVFLIVAIALKLFQVIILARLQRIAQRTRTKFDDTLIEIFRGIRPPFYFLASLYVGIRALVLPLLVSRIIGILFIIVAVYEAIHASEKIIDFIVTNYIGKKASGEKEKEGKKHNEAVIRTSRILLKGLLWIFGLILIFSNLGINVTSLITGLGIGGIAIALAIQNVLGDLFSSFSIFVDKPFQVGDFIIVGSDRGVVEKIGLKSTRLRTLQGEELVISNRELTEIRVHNFKKMEQRRVLFSLGVVYGTSEKQLKKIPRLIKKIIRETKLAKFDRCHFEGYGDSSLNFETVYYVKTGDYTTYMDTREKINLAIYGAFKEEGIVFAFPTRSIYIEKNEK